ncbi:MAG: Ig-like domain-containing protein [Caldilineaceae bacterium]
MTVNVLANDGDVNGDALTVTGVSKPQFGTATTDGQRVTYTPNAGFAGEDSFSYFVSDGNGNRTRGRSPSPSTARAAPTSRQRP